jgi:hypothetical protein
MPWTRRQVRYLLSSGSPLSGAQKGKMKDELHANPAMGHEKKGSSAMKHHMREMRIEVHRGKDGKVTGHTVHHHMQPKKAGKSGAFVEETHHSFPFGAGQHEAMMDHVSEHLGGGDMEAPDSMEDDGSE